MAESQEKYGALLETCDEGTKCREEIIKDVKENMWLIWKDVIEQFGKSVKGAVSDTRHIVSEDWEKMISC